MEGERRGVQKVQSASLTVEFGHEYEAERARWLRRRFLWYAGVLAALGALSVVAGALLSRDAGVTTSQLVLSLGLTALSTTTYAAALVYVARRRIPTSSLLSIALWLIVVNGLLQFVGAIGAVELQVATDRPVSRLVAWGVLSQIFLSHVLACLFLPWTPRESARPLVPLLALNALVTLVYPPPGGPWVTVLVIAASPVIGLPGAAVCWWRHSRFRDRFALQALRGRYAEMKRELFNARTIHESLFPRPITDGPVRFAYRYEPARQIGGDFAFASAVPDRSGAARVVNTIVIDVTGHGISAALTVNRLHGELERLYAENPGARPGEVLKLLNRYVHLTLATHSVYCTAVCARIDSAAGTLEYASGGHPPAFLRAVDGTIDELESTSLVLGAARDEDFDAAPQSRRFGPGDTLLIYTDGAVEARDANRRMFGVAGLRRLLATGLPDLDGGWPSAIVRAVNQHRSGPPEDDTLVVEIYQPIDAARGPATGSAADRSKAEGRRSVATGPARL